MFWIMAGVLLGWLTGQLRGAFRSPQTPFLSTYYPINLVDVTVSAGQNWAPKYTNVYLNSAGSLQLNMSISGASLTVNFGVTPVQIDAIQIQGGLVIVAGVQYQTFITNFRIAYTPDGSTWVTPTDPPAFSGAQNVDTVATLPISPPILATMIRLFPISADFGGQSGRVVGIRLEILGALTCRP